MPGLKRLHGEQEQRFAARVRPVREIRGLSQEKLAAKAGVPQTSISKIEAGTSGVNLSYALALCEALNVDLLDMLDEAPLQVVTVG
jgi:transcriptional regulator with XRE-family HTH domain